MDKTTEIAHQRGMIPDIYYNQLNGKTAQENYNEYLRNRAEIHHEIAEEITQEIFDKV